MNFINKVIVFIYEYLTIRNEITGRKLKFFRVNLWNRFVNKIVNSKLAIRIKELFYFIGGFPYPEYLYWQDAPDSQHYLAVFKKEWIEEARAFQSDTTLTNDKDYAMDVGKLWFWEKYQLQKDVNRAFNLTKEKGFEFKRNLTYFEGLTDSRK